MPGQQEVLVGASAAATAQQFLDAAEELGTAVTALLSAAAALTDERVWDGATARRFRADQQLMAAQTRTMSASLTKIAKAALEVIEQIDKDDADGGSGGGMSLLTRANDILSGVDVGLDLGGSYLLNRTATKYANQAAKASEYVKGLPEQRAQLFEPVNALAHDADNGLATPEQVAAAAARYQSLADEAQATGEAALKTTGRLSTGFKYANRTFGALNVASDVSSLIKPNDKGDMGMVDRFGAGANLGTSLAGTATGGKLLTSGITSTAGVLTKLPGVADDGFLAGLADANSLDEIPGVGEAIMAVDVGTGIYYAADTIYDYRGDIAGAASSAGHTVMGWGDDIGSTVSGWF